MAHPITTTTELSFTEELALSEISFTVYGLAQPAGSKRGFVVRGRAILTDANPKSRVWKEQVASRVRDVYTGPLLTGPLELEVSFYRPRPKGHYNSKGALNKAGSASDFPTSAPDTTKLVRGVEDALQSVLYQNDAQIVCQVAWKFWGEPARAEITVRQLEQ